MFRSKSNSSAEERNVRLMHHLSITAEDVEINRQGKLTDKQRVELTQKSKQSGPIILMIGFVILIVAVVIIAFQLNNEGILDNFDSETIIIPIIGLGGSFGLYLIFLIYAAWRAWKDKDRSPDDMEIKSITGKVKLTSTESSGVILNVRRKKIYVKHPKAEEAFIPRTEYTVFYIKGYGIGYFLSAEALD